MHSRQPKVVKVASAALEVAERSFPAYAHLKSPRKFRLPQMVACVLMKTWLKQDYRGFVDLLTVSPPLCRTLGLKKIPHYSTLAYVFKNRFSEESMGKMIAQVVRQSGIAQSAVAVDSTGIEANAASPYYAARRGQIRAWSKLSVAVLIPSFFIASAHANWFPVNDRTEFVPVVEPAMNSVKITDLYADAGYDAEWIHRWCRDGNGIRSWIPPNKVRQDGTAGGYWRNVMAAGLPKHYGRRWGAETVFSAIKRRWGAGTRARTLLGQKKETLLKAVVYAVDR